MSASRLLQATAAILASCALVFGLEAFLYQQSREAGDVIVFIHPLIFAPAVWLAANRISIRSAIVRTVGGAVVAGVMSYANFYFLRFLIVDALKLPTADLFSYFATVYGLFPPVAMALGGLAAALAAPKKVEGH